MMDILDIIKDGVWQGYDDSDNDACAEECKLRWGSLTKSSVLVEYHGKEMVIFAKNKGAGFIAKKQFYRKTKQNPPSLVIGLPDEDIVQHWAFDWNKDENPS